MVICLLVYQQNNLSRGTKMFHVKHFRKEVKQMAKVKYYNLQNILSKKCVYNIIFGERSNGKTYSVLKYALEQYEKTGGQLAIVRRWREDIVGRRASDIFSALNNNGEIEKISNGKYTGVTYFASKFYLCNYDEESKRNLIAFLSSFPNKINTIKNEHYDWRKQEITMPPRIIHSCIDSNNSKPGY